MLVGYLLYAILPFPALAGMNRFKTALEQLTDAVPRARGDEP